MPALVIPVLLVLLAGTLFAVDRSAPASAGGDAARFVPPDGHAARYRNAQGSVDAVENARLIGVEGLFTAPDVVASTVFGSIGETALGGVQLWRETLTAADGSQYSDLYLIDDRGISEVAAWGGPVGFTFDPALLLMPADAAAGDEWSSSGSAFGGGVLTYTAEYRASAPPASMPAGDGEELEIAPDCLRVEGSLTVEQPGTGPLLESTGTSIWCPAQGRVLTAGEQNGQPVLSALAGSATPLAAARVREEEEETESPSGDPGNVTALDAVAVDQFFGESVKQGAVSIPPAVTEAGVVVLANDRGDDLQAWRLGDGRATLDWSAHPGGVIVAVAAAGELTLAATSDRAVHAYDELGRRLWTWRGDELALAPPVGASSPASGSVVATRDGRVSLLAAEDGTERWTAALGADTRGAFVVAGGTVVLADERGRLSGIDAATGELRWRDDDAGMIEAITAPADGAAVYAATFDNELLSVDPATGEARWEDRFTGILQTLTATVDGVVLATDEEVIGYDLGGAESWRTSGGDGLPILGAQSAEGATVTVRGRSVIARSPDGKISGKWVLPAEAATADASVVSTGEDLVLVDSFLRFWRMEAR